MTTYEIDVGAILLGRFDGNRRRDIFVDKRGERHDASVFAAGPKDKSPHQRKYDARCSCCWLNFGHTEEAHAQRLQS